MRYSLAPSPRARALAERLELREAILQVCCPVLSFDPSEARGVGAAHIPKNPRERVVELVRRLHAVSEVPPLCTADLECGAGRAVLGLTDYPDLMGLGAAGSEELAYRVGSATALEGRSVGLSWTFSPCADLAEVPDSPAVSTRSAGRDVERVLRVTRGYMRGLQDHGLAATLKHFPGDGHTSFDQHLTTVQLPHGMAEWWGGPGAIYRELIEAGAKTIMAGHIALPAYDEPDPRVGLCPPATLSRRLLTELLRGELGFEGLIVSDAMNMGGVAGFTHPFEAYARFLEAGGDCVLFARVRDRRFFPEMERLLGSGVLRESTVYARAARMIAFKEDLGLLDAPERFAPSAPLELATLEGHAALARDVADRGVALMRDRTRLLPVVLGGEQRVLHVVLSSSYEEQRPIYAALTAALGRRSQVDELVDPGPHALFERVDGYDLVVCSIGAPASWGVNVARLHGPICRNLMEGWMRLGTPVVFVSHQHPFIHLEYEPVMDCVINTFRGLESTAERLVRGLVGEQPFTGSF